MATLWIGTPSQLREIPHAPTEYDRTPDLGASEFRALGGGVTVTYQATPPRRLSLSFSALADDDARWLEALARRVYGPGPVVVFDPTSVNMLAITQAAGTGELSQWQVVNT